MNRTCSGYLLHCLLALALTISLSHAGQTTKVKERFGCRTRTNDFLREFYLYVHNRERLRLAKGNSPNFRGKPFSSSKNMYKLRWSCLLEEIAQSAVSSCRADINGYRSYGINLATFSVSDGRATSSQINWRETIKIALISWFSEARKSRWNNPENRFTTANISFFANMVHSKTTEVGCAHQLCTGKIQIACMYNRLGTFINTTIWRTGNPCQQDADCTSFPNSTCGGIGKEKGLCLAKQEDPDDGKSSICKGMIASPNMTDSVRQKFLNLHNHYRSLVARGKAYDKILGENVPTASKMQKLKYTCRLEETAWKYAQKCTFRHSPLEERNNAGENLYRNSIPGFDKLRVASMATEDWFEESEDFGIGGAPVFSAEIAANAGHYTQMIWQNTKQIGCAIANCYHPAMTLVVCHYSNAGNIDTHRVYKSGIPCSECDPKERCDPEEGLCYTL